MIEKFKILTLRKSELGSFSIHRNRGGWGITYLPGKWVSATLFMMSRNYHLTVFPTYEIAFDYSGFGQFHTSIGTIWRCEVKGKVDPLPQFLDPYHVSYGKLCRYHCLSTTWPRGTEMYKQVKLTEQVYPKER